MTITKEVLDELLSGVENANDLLGDQGLMKELKVRLMERMLGAELTEHLGYEADAQPSTQQSNRRNGTTRKTLKGNDGAIPIDVPRDRDGSFEPELIKKGQTRIDGMDDKIIGLYAAGLSTRDIRDHLEEVYGLKVSADLSVASRMLSWRKCLTGKIARWNRCTPSFFSMPYALKSATQKAVRSKTRPSMWPWASPLKGNARFWACGLPTTKGPNSGSR
jgi:hypothetical protein